MDNDRLSVLRRQRDLIHKHLAWLETEIVDAERGDRKTEAAIHDENEAEAIQAPEAQSAPAAQAASLDAQDDALPTLDETDIRNDVRRGCLLYAAVAGACGVLLIGLIYWIY